MPYDYLIFALGRRLATEKVRGFYEHANHLLTPQAALKFGAAVASFHQGHALSGIAPGRSCDPGLKRRLLVATCRNARRGAVALVLSIPTCELEEFGGRELATKLYRTRKNTASRPSPISPSVKSRRKMSAHLTLTHSLTTC